MNPEQEVIKVYAKQLKLATLANIVNADLHLIHQREPDADLCA